MVISDSLASPDAAPSRHGEEEEAGSQVSARKGGDVARQIGAIVRECGITLEEEGDLLHLLEKLDHGEEIPPELYTMVAELLAFAYAVNGKYPDLQ